MSGSHVRVDEERFGLWRLLIRDTATVDVRDMWHANDGFPTTDEVPIHMLFDAKWRYRPLHESAMYDVIRDALLDEGCAEAPDDLSTTIRAMHGGTPTEPGVEQLRRPDLWVLEGRSRKALVIVEVKRHARHQPGSDYDPVDQVLSYVQAAHSALSNGPFQALRIRPMIVAHEIDTAERSHARAQGVECRLLTKRTRELKRL